jgi:hypothetical protein
MTTLSKSDLQEYFANKQSMHPALRIHFSNFAEWLFDAIEPGAGFTKPSTLICPCSPLDKYYPAVMCTPSRVVLVDDSLYIESTWGGAKATKVWQFDFYNNPILALYRVHHPLPETPARRFYEGMAVTYVPNHAGGDLSHPACEHGTVSSVGWYADGTEQVWVRYSTGQTGALTPVANLV